MHAGLWIALLSSIAVAVAFGSIAFLAATPTLLGLRSRLGAGAAASAAGAGPAAPLSPAPPAP